ncbi:MAG: DJ-1/PfpI family protein [Actinobacteria bacterium]|nr:DJ-1/PfpI family protein [Actinomycetota bacterium]
MFIAITLFDGITALDAVGPYEVLSRVPGASVQFVATVPGLKRDQLGSLGLQADLSLADVPRCDVVLVPGGPGTAVAASDPELLDWLRQVDQTTTWTTSVCTGALLLGAAGLLQGRRATTHWLSTDKLADHGATWTDLRVVVDGKYMSAAGVSAGMDMALALAAELADDVVAQAIQLSVEYDPQPPYSAGSPATAPPAIVEHLRRAVRKQT